VAAVTITLEADFDQMDARGQIRLEDLHMRERTPFAKIAGKHEEIIFANGRDGVCDEMAGDLRLGWIGPVERSAQDVRQAYARWR